jgi:hypothetical protein
VRALTALVVDGEGVERRSAWLDAAVAIAIAVALIGILFLPLLSDASTGSSLAGRTVIREQRELCYGCVEDAPYPMLLWLELVVCVSSLVAGLGLCVRGGGARMVVRTVALVAAAIILLWAPVQTESRDRPIAILPLFELAGVAVLVVAASAVRTTSPRWVRVVRAVLVAVAGFALLLIPGTRGQMPFTYDQLRWGYVIAAVATAVALAAAIWAAVAPPTRT